MNTQLPDWFWADRLTPFRYYGYPSSVRERIFEINMHEVNETNSPLIDRFHDVKRRCMDTELNVSTDENPIWSKDIWDNKVVIELKTERGASIYIGCYDGVYSIGLSVEPRDKQSPKAYKNIKEKASA